MRSNTINSIVKSFFLLTPMLLSMEAFSQPLFVCTNNINYQLYLISLEPTTITFSEIVAESSTSNTSWVYNIDSNNDRVLEGSRRWDFEEVDEYFSLNRSNQNLVIESINAYGDSTYQRFSCEPS